MAFACVFVFHRHLAYYEYHLDFLALVDGATDSDKVPKEVPAVSKDEKPALRELSILKRWHSVRHVSSLIGVVLFCLLILLSASLAAMAVSEARIPMA